MSDWIKAGKICREAREFAKEICKENKTHLEVVEKIEEKIIKLGGKPAFPVDLSVNHIAAHQSPGVDDEKVLNKEDLIKIDIGVHVNGCIADTAVTVEIGSNKYKNLIKASEEALKEAVKLAIPGIKLREVGFAIQEKINEFGFLPITNLSGHGLDLYEVHTKPTVPNYDNGDENKLIEGMYIAIEPFATTGVGQVKDGKPAGIYRLANKKPVRIESVRRLLEYIEKEFKTLPFSPRWIKHLSNYQFALRILEQQEIIKQYTELPEKGNGMVSQAEHTVFVEENECRVLT